MTTTVYVKKTGGGVSCILTLTQRPSRANHNVSSAPLAATLTVVGVGFIMFEVVDLLLAKLFIYRLQVSLFRYTSLLGQCACVMCSW